MSITVHTMGVHYRWLRDLPRALSDELWRAHSLREDLVTLEHQHEDAKRAIWSSYPGVAAAEAALAAADGAAADAAEAVKAERIAARSKTVSSAASARLRAARADAKAARVARREAIAAVHTDATARLRAAQDGLKAAHKELYRSYCTNGSMYWATFNDVLNHHATAVKRVAARRKAGAPASLRHHRYDGSGTIAVQLQRASSAPARTPATIADGDTGRWRNVLHVPGWVDPDTWGQMTRAQRRSAGRVTVRMRCGPGHIEVPVQAHRWLPTDADITMARLTLTRVGTDLRGSLSLTAKIPDPEPVVEGPAVAVHLGWHRDETLGGVVAATWRASEPLAIPADLATVFRPDPGARTGRVVLPNRVTDRLAAHADADSRRDLGFDQARARLCEWLDERGPVDDPTRPDEMLGRVDVASWRNPSRLARLVLAWRDTPPTGGADVLPELEAWRAADKREWNALAHGRRAAAGHRDDLYRQIAAVIADQAGTLVVDDTGVAAIARLDTDLPTEVEQRIARQRAFTAPGALREACVAAATREGVPVHTVAAAGLSRIHASCGHNNGPDKDYGGRQIICDGCGKQYDTDLSATLLMLRRAVDSAAA